MKSLGNVLLGILLAATGLFASSGEVRREPIKGELRLIYVFEEPKTAYILVIGQSGFKSVNSLKRYLETWPPGSELKWAPGCSRLGGEPLLSSEQEMKAFRAFLKREVSSSSSCPRADLRSGHSVPLEAVSQPQLCGLLRVSPANRND